MAIESGEIGIYGILRNDTTEGTLAKTDQLWDDNLQKYQSEINQDVNNIAYLEERITQTEEDVASLQEAVNTVNLNLSGKVDSTTYEEDKLNFALRSEIPTNVSELVNDSGYITKDTADGIYQPIGDYATASQLDSKQDVLVSGTNIKTINGETILGDGNIEITDTAYEVATQSSNGLLSAADKTKLDNITEDADSVSFTASLSSGTVIGTLTINGTSYTLYSTDNTTYNTATTSSDGLMSSTDKVKVDLLETDGNGSRYLTNAGTYVNPFPVVTEEEALTILADGTISHRGISQMKDWDITTTDYDLDYLNSTYPDAPVGFQLVQYANGKMYEKVSSTGQWMTYSCTLLE